ALGAVVAAGTGWIHGASAGESSGLTLQRHQWLGFVTAAIALAAVVPLVASRGSWRWSLAMYRVGAVACGLLVAITAHLGGTLTHGEGYLTELIFQKSAAQPLASSVTSETSPAPAMPVADVAAIRFPADGHVDFARDVQPI